MRKSFSKYFVFFLFYSTTSWANPKGHFFGGNRESGAKKDLSELFQFKPTKAKATKTVARTTETKKEAPAEEVYGNLKQKAFQRYVLSDKYEQVVWKMGHESGNVYDCSAFVQKVLEDRNCTPPNMPARLTTGANMRHIFGPPKKCAPGDIVHYPGHMGFYHSPGKFLGANSGQKSVGIHRSSGTCYANPCNKRLF